MATDETPLTFDCAYPGRFLKAGQLLDDKPTFTITRVYHDILAGEKGDKQKLIISFRETQFELVACKLNGVMLRAMFGDRCADWKGKRLTLFATDQLMPFPGKKGLDRFCIRIWGSPDIEQDIMVEFQPPKRKELTLHCHAVSIGQRRQQAQQQPGRQPELTAQRTVIPQATTTPEVVRPQPTPDPVDEHPFGDPPPRQTIPLMDEPEAEQPKATQPAGGLLGDLLAKLERADSLTSIYVVKAEAVSGMRKMPPADRDTWNAALAAKVAVAQGRAAQ